MKRLTLIFALILTSLLGFAAPSVLVKESQIPILIDRNDNILFYLRIEPDKAQMLSSLSLKLSTDMAMENIDAIKFYFSGTEAPENKDKLRFAPVEYISRSTPGQTRSANLSYSIKLVEINEIPENGEIKFSPNKKFFPLGVNYFWVSIKMKSDAPLTQKVFAKITDISIDDRSAEFKMHSPENITHRLGIGVRHAGDDNSAAYRIPGLVTTKKGTLLAVYDVRYNNSADLQERVDIGLSRSTDGGQTWEKMKIPMTFGEDNGMPSAQNGVGDPAILVDEKTGAIWIIATWTQGLGNGRAWTNSQPGMGKGETAQLMLTRSDDDGLTWSAPINITNQVKQPGWYFCFQGPGRGITMNDGTLVFPAQYINDDRDPRACIIYSKDRGTTWHLHSPARTNTTESQVVELNPGTLMLNMRDNRGGSRAVATTSDLGKTWVEHPSSRRALREPVCMASLLKASADENIYNRDLLLFSNPNTTSGRYDITIKGSLDFGTSWTEADSVLLDEDRGWGYSCLSMIDKETVGIIYEGSTAHMVFQAIPLKDIFKNLDSKATESKKKEQEKGKKNSTRKYSTYYYQRATLFAELPGTKKDVIFLGNSITDGGEWCELFDNKNIKNRGISGDIAYGVYDRLDDILTVAPSKIFLLIGINDVARGTLPDTIVSRIGLIVDKIKRQAPSTKIYLQSVLPVNPVYNMFQGHTSRWQLVPQINQKMQVLAKEKKCTYIDIFTPLSDGDNKLNPNYTNDGLHLLGPGYLKWAEVVKPYVFEK